MVSTLSRQPVDAAQRFWYDYLQRDSFTNLREDDRRYEIVRGVRREKRMGVPETLIANELKSRLEVVSSPSRAGRVVIGVPFDLPVVETRRIPDLAFISAAAWPLTRRVPAGAAWDIAPELVVEVISPFDNAHEVLVKVQEYFGGAVRLVWLVWPHIEQVYVYTSPTSVRILSRTDTLTADDLLPGFRLSLADLFPPAEEEPPPAAG